MDSQQSKRSRKRKRNAVVVPLWEQQLLTLTPGSFLQFQDEGKMKYYVVNDVHLSYVVGHYSLELTWKKGQETDKIVQVLKYVEKKDKKIYIETEVCEDQTVVRQCVDFIYKMSRDQKGLFKFKLTLMRILSDTYLGQMENINLELYLDSKDIHDQVAINLMTTSSSAKIKHENLH